jgi:hypothetical protein
MSSFSLLLLFLRIGVSVSILHQIREELRHQLWNRSQRTADEHDGSRLLHDALKPTRRVE